MITTIADTGSAPGAGVVAQRAKPHSLPGVPVRLPTVLLIYLLATTFREAAAESSRSLLLT